MQDRFKFRCWDKENKCMHYPTRYSNFNIVNGVIVKIESYLTGNGVYRGKGVAYEFDDAILMQCTGLKDKNDKLIYEGDIVKYAEFDWTDFSFKDWETEIAQVVWGNTYDNYYPAFDLKDTDFDGTNAFAYLFNEGWTIEVIGNIYQNPELLEG